MNKKVLKVLSYIGVGLLGAFLGMGALIGVSSCAQKRDDHTQINKKAVMPKRSVYNDDNKVNMNNLEDGYMLTFKSDFYDITKDFSRWYNHEEWVIDLNPNNAYSNWQNNGDALWRVFQFEFDWYGDQLILGYHYLNGADNNFTTIFNYAEDSNNHWLVNDNCKTFWIKDFNEVTNGSVFENFFKSIFDITKISFTNSSDFIFNQQINYNADYASSVNNDFVPDSDMNTPSSYKLKYIIEDKFFMSGGYLFNQARLRFMNAVAHSFIDDNGDYDVLGVNGFATYMWLEYQNTITGKLIIVNQRNASTRVNASGNVYSTTEKGSTWVSNNYRKITILDGVDEQLGTFLGRYNNDTSQFSDFTSNDNVGLGNVFQLIGFAFSSMIPLMSIQIIPGISIGLMLFLPLIVGIIILIIWLVKR